MKILLFILFPIILSAQIQTKDYIAVGMAFVGGVADGVNQTIRHHYYIFQEKHPNHNELFWGPDSWKNKWKLNNGELIPTENPKWYEPKYEERFLGSSTIFVPLTDGHHLTREIDKYTAIGGSVLITIGEKQPWWHYALRFTAVVVARQAGFYLTHDIYYK